MNAFRELAFRALGGLLVLLAPGMILVCCNNGSDNASPTTVTIGPDGGSITHADARLVIPAGAMSEDVEFTVATTEAPVALPDGATQVGSVYSFTPHGQAFDSPVTIELPYSGSLVGLSVLVLDDDADSAWDPVSGVSFADNKASFQVEHLSYYVVSRSDGPQNALIATLSIPDGKPGALCVDDSQNLMVFDANTDNTFNRPHLRFFQVDYDDQLDGFSFELGTEEVSVPWTSGIPQGWFAHDRNHGLIYVVSLNGQTTSAGIGWDQIWVQAVAGRAEAGSFTYNIDGGDPSTAPADFNIAIAGFAIKEAQSEGDNPTRLFIHDIVGGNIDILDLDASGTALVSWERQSYRDRLESGCTWPPDPPPWDCHWLGTQGNTLGLEWANESQNPDALSDHDLLYLTDHNYSGAEIRVISIPQSAPFDLQFLPDVDMSAAHDILANGIEGLSMAGSSDTLYVATGIQSFGEGYIGTVDTVSQAPGVISVPFSDNHDVVVDPSDPSRIFVAVSDSFEDNPALLVHEIVDQVVVKTVQVLESYDGSRVEGMAYDSAHGLLFLVVADEILVARMD
jgi:hypothetical protein